MAARLTGLHANAAGNLFLWNQEQLLRCDDTGIRTRCGLNGRPLGWCELGQERGLLSVDENRLVLQQV